MTLSSLGNFFFFLQDIAHFNYQFYIWTKLNIYFSYFFLLRFPALYSPPYSTLKKKSVKSKYIWQLTVTGQNKEVINFTSRQALWCREPRSNLALAMLKPSSHRLTPRPIRAAAANHYHLL